MKRMKRVKINTFFTHLFFKQALLQSHFAMLTPLEMHFNLRTDPFVAVMGPFLVSEV